MSLTFAEILQQELNTRRDQGLKIPASTDVDLISKGLELKGAISVRAEDEIDEQDLEEYAERAALARIGDLLDGILSTDLLDSRVTNKTKSKGQVSIPTKAVGLRARDGRFISSSNLALVLNLTLAAKIKERMVAPKLVYRTGRFANSAHITEIDFAPRTSRQGKGTVSIFFSYMLYPYQVFEPHPTRNPTPLIKEALDAALKRALSPDSFRNNIFNGDLA